MPKFKYVVPALLLALGMAGTTGAGAVPLGLTRGAIPNAGFVPEGEVALAPIAHVKFCMFNASECETSAEGATRLGAEALPMIEAVNREVNARIRPQSKFGDIGDWTVAPDRGDCNDYAVTKRHALIALGLSANALRLAVVRTSWGEGHLVLVASLENGDYVLDNLSTQVKPWAATGHRFLKVQAQHDARAWLTVERSAARDQSVRVRSVARVEVVRPSRLEPRDDGSWFQAGL